VGRKVDGGLAGNAHAGFSLIGPGEIDGSASARGGNGGQARGSGNGGADGQAKPFSASLQYYLDIQGSTTFQHLIVGLLDVNFTGSDFDFVRLEFSIHDQGHGVPLYNIIFTDAAPALAFFDDRILDLGSGSAILGSDPDLPLIFSNKDTRKPLKLWFEGLWYITNQDHGVGALGLFRNIFS